jgi:hypothetical protein
MRRCLGGALASAAAALALAALAAGSAENGGSGYASTVSLDQVPGAASGAPEPLFQALIVDGALTTVAPSARARLGAPDVLASLIGRITSVGFLSPAYAATPTEENATTLTIDHQGVGCVVAERYPRVDACLQPRAGVGRAQVFFRPTGTTPWYAVDMQPEEGCYTALLPKPRASLQAFQYYISAIDLDFGSRQEPDRAPDEAHTARVVAAEGDCEKDARVARFALKAASPLVVESLTGSRVPEGFSEEGVAASGAGLAVSLVATGASSGEVLQLQATNASGRLVRVAIPPGLVLVPVHGGGAPVAARAKGPVQTAPISGFCLDFAKPPPSPGTLYRIADVPAQESFRPMRGLLEAGRRLSRQGRFHPDSDPKAYGDSIRQWALWARLSGWAAPQFADAFVSRTRKNVEQMKRNWTPEMEAAIRGAAPGRWKDVSQVLDEAPKPDH